MTNSLDSILAHLQYTSNLSVHTVSYVTTIKQVQLHILLNIVHYYRNIRREKLEPFVKSIYNTTSVLDQVDVGKYTGSL